MQKSGGARAWEGGGRLEFSGAFAHKGLRSPGPYGEAGQKQTRCYEGCKDHGETSQLQWQKQKQKTNTHSGVGGGAGALIKEVIFKARSPKGRKRSCGSGVRVQTPRRGKVAAGERFTGLRGQRGFAATRRGLMSGSASRAPLYCEGVWILFQMQGIWPPRVSAGVTDSGC